MSEPLPLDPGIHSGRLDNGLTYFIETNDEPQDRVELRLVIRAGSVLEDDDQQGLAHVVEHMAFNGSEHFPGNTLIDHLERIGARFGPHLNAYTSFDETVYKLHVPSNEEALNTAFLAARDWATGLSFDPEEIEKERGVVLEEWRRNQGAAGRRAVAAIPVQMNHSRYAERLPIGTEESLNTFTHEALTRFYKAWYRPDLMSVIVVGDIEASAAEALIHKHFTALENPSPTRERVALPIPPHETPEALVYEDPELRSATAMLGVNLYRPEGQDHASYYVDIQRRLFLEILNARLREVGRQAEAPFMHAGARSSRLNDQTVSHVLAVSAPVEGILEGIDATRRELARAAEHGFSDLETERAKRRTLKSMERAFQRRGSTDSASHAQEIIRHVTRKEPMPGIAYELELYRQTLPTLSPAALQREAQRFFDGGEIYVILSTPPQDGQRTLQEAEVLARLGADVEGPLAPWVANNTDASLIETPPTPGAIVEEVQLADVDTLRWTLSNGARFTYKYTDFSEQTVQLAAFAWGGHSLYPDPDYLPALTATAIGRSSGLGGLDAAGLEDFLAGKSLGIKATIDELSVKLQGQAATGDLDAFFQLLHATMISPRFDSTAFEVSKRRQIEALKHRGNTPQAAFSDAWADALWDKEARRRRPLSVDDIEGMDLARSEAIYRESFEDASFFDFYLVGDVSPEFLRPLVAQWVASLPGSGESRSYADLGLTPRPGEQEIVVTKGVAPKSTVRLLLYGADGPVDRVDRHALRSVSDVLEVRLREELREKMGGVYSVGVGLSAPVHPVPKYSVTVQFTCEPERRDALLEATDRVIAEVISGPPSDDLLVRIKETQRRSWEVQREKNRYWLSAFRFADTYGLTVAEVIDRGALIDGLTGASIQESAARYLKGSHRLVGILDPEPNHEIQAESSEENP